MVDSPIRVFTYKQTIVILWQHLLDGCQLTDKLTIMIISHVFSMLVD